jgi:anti-sigma factor RsiW
VTPACNDFDALLSLHAAGALEPADAARVEAHLAACARCRAEAARDAEALSLARLAPPSDAERRALADVPRRTLADLERWDPRQPSWKRFAAISAVSAAAVVAAVVVALVAPAGFRQAPTVIPVPPSAVVVETTPAWEAPDLDTLWEDAGLLDVDATAVAYGTGSDAALAAVDF